MTKAKTLYLTDEIANLLRSHCLENNIESENELIRAAIVHYVKRGYEDSTFHISTLKSVEDKTASLQKQTTMIFNYIHLMHQSLLCYLPELDDSLHEAAVKSAKYRADYFMNSFVNNLKKDSSMFQGLLHSFVTGELDE